jgi:hypothetical protein
MDELPTETQDQVIGALGRAIVKLWSQLPHDFQQHLFEEAVRSEGESVRQGGCRLSPSQASAYVRFHQSSRNARAR